MALECYHQRKLEDHSENAEESEFIPSMSSKFTETDHATANVTREKEIVSLAIWNSN